MASIRERYDLLPKGVVAEVGEVAFRCLEKVVEALVRIGLDAPDRHAFALETGCGERNQ
jgi:hypothetical protein